MSADWAISVKAGFSAVAAVMNCGSYEEADAALTALYPNLDNRVLQGYLQNALFLSDLLGQANAQH